MEYAGKGTNAVKNCGYFPACSEVVMLKIEARSVCTKREAVAQPEKRIRANKFACKLGLGMKFAGNVDFCGCNEDFNKKTEGKNVLFVVFL